MKIKNGIYLSTLLGLTIFGITGCSKSVVKEKKNDDFQALCQRYFLDTVGDDAYYWNVIAENPSKFGYEGTLEAKWYCYETTTEQDLVDARKELNELIDELDSFKGLNLSTNEKYTYRTLVTKANNKLSLYKNASLNDLLIGLDYIDSQGGYVAYFTQSMQGYHINNYDNALEVISYLSSTPEALKSYLTYAEDKKNANYPLIDTSVNGMIDYLDSILKKGDNFYLKEVINKKIDDCQSISDGDATQLKANVDKAFKDSFLEAVKILRDGLKSYVGVTNNNGYYGYYGDKGKEAYRRDLADRLGIDYTKVDDNYMNNYIKTLESNITKYSKNLAGAISNANRNGYYGETLSYIEGDTSLTGITDVNDMIPYLKTFAKTIVKDLSDDKEIVIDQMDETVQDITTTVAYYAKSALDSTEKEFITLNPKYCKDNVNDTLATLSHEGYPGHLYSYCLLKEQDMPDLQKILLNNVAFGEGWAVYVETQLFDYIKANNESKAIKYACDYYKASTISNFALYTRIDAGIHYEGWNIGDVATYLGKFGYNSSAAGNLYNSLVEIPTQYASYGYGTIKFVDAHEKAREALGKKYNELDMNEAILTHGWVGLDDLDVLTDEYIKSYK